MTHTKHHVPRARRIVTVTLALALILMVGAYFALPALSGCTYTITDGGTETQITSHAAETKEVLAQAGISLTDYDKVTVTGGSAHKVITISRSQSVSINNGGSMVSTVAYGGTIGDLLQTLSISVGTGDTLTVDGAPVSTLDATYDGMELDITRTTTKTQVTTEEIPYDTVSYLDPTLPVGETQVQYAGSAGTQEVTTELIYENGQLVSSEQISTKVLSQPTDEVVLIGSQQTFSESETAVEVYTEPEPEPSTTPEAKTESAEAAAQTKLEETPAPSAAPEPDPEPEPEPSASPESSFSGSTITTEDGQVLTYSSTLSVEATAYTGGGTTATGTAARYGAIAVDPSVIPYGTRMYIVSDDGKWIYGVATAEDCGGAIKGHIIDLYFDDYNTCIQFGRRNCTVYILD